MPQHKRVRPTANVTEKGCRVVDIESQRIELARDLLESINRAADFLQHTSPSGTEAEQESEEAKPV